MRHIEGHKHQSDTSSLQPEMSEKRYLHVVSELTKTHKFPQANTTVAMKGLTQSTPVPVVHPNQKTVVAGPLNSLCHLNFLCAMGDL
jgi:hypothetical protein